MVQPLEPWWSSDLLTHPLAAAHVVDPGKRWEPTPSPAPRVEAGERNFRVSWRLDEFETSAVDVEVVGDLLVLRAVADGHPLSRAIPLPPDVDLSRRRDHWSTTTLEVVVPRIRPTFWGRVRMWIARVLRQIAATIAPND